MPINSKPHTSPRSKGWSTKTLYRMR